MENSRLMEVLTHVIVLFTAFPVHECAHGWAAKLMGDDTAEKEGRLTLNPVKHLSLFGTLCMIFMGFGWAKPVPINPNKFKNPKNGMALSALAGPVSNLVMAFIAMIVYRFLYMTAYMKGGGQALMIAIRIFEYMVILNVGLAVFNLLPVPPLDGSRIFGLIMPERLYFKVMQYERYVFLVLMIVVYSGLLDGVIYKLQQVTISAMSALTDWVDLIFIFINGGNGGTALAAYGTAFL